MNIEFEGIECSNSYFDAVTFNGSDISIEVSFVNKEKEYNPYVEKAIEVARCKIFCKNVVAYLFLQEFPASVSEIIATNFSKNIISKFESAVLTEALGIGKLSESLAINSYVITPKWGDVLVIYTPEEPKIEKLA